MPSGKVLFVDAYDSFSNSIVSLLKSELAVTVEAVKIDDARFVLNDEAFYRYLDGFDAVVAGPGPGHPENSRDIGLIGRLWHLPDEHILPVLGICLGFQSLCYAFGGHIRRLREPRHGVTANITHCDKDIFTGAGDVVATQYHSLHARLGGRKTEHTECLGLWTSFGESKDLLPLAWDLTSAANGPVLMATRHQHKPFWGVQYHPESICTNGAGRKLIANWWRAVNKFVYPSPRDACPHRKIGMSGPGRPTSPNVRIVEHTNKAIRTRQVQYKMIDLSLDFDLTHLMELFDNGHADLKPLLLESGTRNGRPVNSETGRVTIMALRDKASLQLRYHTGSHHLVIESGCKVALKAYGTVTDAFSYIDDLMHSIKASDGPSKSPFWGGLVGFVSYEAGLETIGVSPSEAALSRPDMWFVLVDRTIVIDHVKHVAYIQSIRGSDDQWLSSSVRKIEKLKRNQSVKAVSSTAQPLSGMIVSAPLETEYSQKINTCKLKLHAGESYELCLTDQSTVTSSMEPWSLYCHLRQRNPAPFGSFLRFSSPSQPGISIVSSSPERFLSWSRQGHCQFRPIKGTVRNTPEMTRETAEMLLSSTKERAENLMIVDLIRHDLSGVSGVDHVRVPKLMSVEEYETVFQLVSVIEGDYDPSRSPTAALAASLPPGSMTGAPKKRSCELLKTIEGEQPRGLYSGVIGFFDAGGGGDFSVVIRTAYKWDDGDDVWRIGAGGAITVLSETEAEWEEMLTKRESVLHSFV